MARLICGVLQSDIPVYTLDSAQHLHGLIQSLNAQGFSLIIGDAVTTAYAQRCSLDAVLITSGIESLESTLNEALYIYELLSVQGAKEGLLRKSRRAEIHTMRFSTAKAIFAGKTLL